MIEPTSASQGASAQTSTGASRRSLADSFDSFLTLLTTQLRNQDPLSPMDTDRFTQQIVEFTSLEQSMKMNASLERLVDLAGGGSRDAAASWLGAVVEATRDRVELPASGSVTIPFRLEADAQVTLKVLGRDGGTLHATTFSGRAGAGSIEWNGRGADGTRLPPGSYRVAVEARDLRNRPVEAEPVVRGTVDAVELDGDQPVLRIGQLRVPLDAVRAVHRAAVAPAATTNEPTTTTGGSRP